MSHERPPTTVQFYVKPDQVWTDPDGVSWYVKSVGDDTAYLQRTVATQISLRDLVRMCHQPNDKPKGFGTSHDRTIA